MSNIRSKINFLLYVIALLVAIFVVYQAFTTGLKKGQFTGKYYPPVDKSTLTVEEKKPANLRLLRISTPEQVAEGKKLYKLNCASCHGEDGRGDGPKAASLVPPPRNFTAEKFKNGASVLQIYNTVSHGIQGTSMPAFDLLPEEDRMAMVHYVQTFVPDPPDDPQDLVDALPVVEGDEVTQTADTTAASGDSAKPAAQPIPIDSAMNLYLAAQPVSTAAPQISETNKLFEQYCSSCHGARGEGTTNPEQIVPEAVVYIRAGVLNGNRSEAVKDYTEFKRFMTSGTYGLEHHRFGFLSESQLRELYQFVRLLAE